jgi:hypothetical protein
MSTSLAILRVQRIQAYNRARFASLPSDVHFLRSEDGVIHCDCGANAEQASHLPHTTGCTWLARRNLALNTYLDLVREWRTAHRNSIGTAPILQGGEAWTDCATATR